MTIEEINNIDTKEAIGIREESKEAARQFFSRSLSGRNIYDEFDARDYIAFLFDGSNDDIDDFGDF